jgi:predicted metalloprotease with PDZ domain
VARVRQEKYASLREFEAKYVSGTDEPDWKTAFANVGVHYETRVSMNAIDRGGPANGGAPEMHLRRFGMVLNDSGDAKLKHVLRDSAAHAAGLCAGDTLVAVDGLKATRNTLAKHVMRFAAGDRITIHYFRQDVFTSTALVVPPALHDTASLSPQQNISPELSAKRGQWLQDSQK